MAAWCLRPSAMRGCWVGDVTRSFVFFFQGVAKGLPKGSGLRGVGGGIRDWMLSSVFFVNEFFLGSSRLGFEMRYFIMFFFTD